MKHLLYKQYVTSTFVSDVGVIIIIISLTVRARRVRRLNKRHAWRRGGVRSGEHRKRHQLDAHARDMGVIGACGASDGGAGAFASSSFDTTEHLQFGHVELVCSHKSAHS